MKNKLTNIINTYQESLQSEVRHYIGASSIGSSCLRQIWYDYKGFVTDNVPAKTRRTWDIGKKLESTVLSWLRDAGIDLITVYFDLLSENVPIFQGHVDAIWKKNDEPYAIIEVKTAKDSSFKIFEKKGLREWNQQYYAQVQSYMGMSNIHKCYEIVLNKDTSDLADELIEFDLNFYNQLERKAAVVASCEEPPSRIHESPLWYQCKMCKFRKICRV